MTQLAVALLLVLVTNHFADLLAARLDALLQQLGAKTANRRTRGLSPRRLPRQSRQAAPDRRSEADARLNTRPHVDRLLVQAAADSKRPDGAATATGPNAHTERPSAWTLAP